MVVTVALVPAAAAADVLITLPTHRFQDLFLPPGGRAAMAATVAGERVVVVPAVPIRRLQAMVLVVMVVILAAAVALLMVTQATVAMAAAAAASQAARHLHKQAPAVSAVVVAVPAIRCCTLPLVKFYCQTPMPTF